MPAPLADVNLDAVEAHVVNHGVADAARAFNIPLNTVKAWSARKGWLKAAGATVTVQPLPKSMIGRPANAATAATAARSSLEIMGERSRLNMAKAVDKGFEAATEMDGEAIIRSASDLNALAKVAQVAHPELRETAAGSGALVNIVFLGPETGLPDLGAGPVVDDMGQG